MTPWIARSIYRAQEAALHRPTFAYWQELERTQWLDRKSIEALQARKLNTLLDVALAHSPWHAARIRAAGLEDALRGGTVSLADLARLPPMNKRDARDNVDQIVWRGVPGGAFLMGRCKARCYSWVSQAVSQRHVELHPAIASCWTALDCCIGAGGDARLPPDGNLGPGTQSAVQVDRGLQG